MAFFDMPLAELATYQPDIKVAADFDDFWTGTVEAELARPLEVEIRLVETPLAAIEVYDVSWVGYAGQRVRAWHRVPVHTSGRLPTILQYRGYSLGRGYPSSELAYVGAGYADLVLDNRAQGWRSTSLTDATPDEAPEAGAMHSPGLMTAGIRSPKTYYYRRLFTDALRMLQVARTLDRVDGTRIVATGGSQGGGISIAVAGLAEVAGLPLVGVVANVPFLCHFERAVGLTDAAPYKEIADYLAAWPHHTSEVFDTLSYFDGANFATRAQIPALFSTALMDQVCAPSTVYAAFNRWGHSDKQIEVYPWNGHEGGGDHQLWRTLGWLADRLQ